MMGTAGNRIRVLHVAQPGTGGVAAVVADLVRAQRASGHDVVVACPQHTPLAAGLARAGVPVEPWAATREPGPRLAGETRQLRQIIRRQRPDIVHLHSSKAGLAGRLAVRGRMATVFQPHAWSFLAVDGAMRAASLGWERLSARWADRVLCVSDDERDAAVRNAVRARFCVVPNGIDVARYAPEERAAARARAPFAPLGLRPETPLVVCVGRLCRQKGQDVLLAAWPRVLERVGAARLALVGDGPDEPLIRTLISRDARLGGVLPAGACEDPRPWFHAADLVVLPSRWEGMALVPLEASACARRVVASDVAGVRESLPADRAPWSVVAPDDPSALADAIADALGDLARDPALWQAAERAAAAHARNFHDVTRVARDIELIYNRILADRAACPSRPAGRPLP
jgi:glycosyltransferase involved in cell wall biosynthesis